MIKVSTSRSKLSNIIFIISLDDNTIFNTPPFICIKNKQAKIVAGKPGIVACAIIPLIGGPLAYKIQLHNKG
jgi:hypothetical protein